MFDGTEKLFKDFVRQNYTDIKSEFFIPILGDDFVHNQHGTIKVIPTSAQWFGVTYKEDAPVVKADVQKLVNEGEYPPHPRNGYHARGLGRLVGCDGAVRRAQCASWLKRGVMAGRGCLKWPGGGTDNTGAMTR